MLTVLLGIGGGFILVPAMIYLLGMPARIVIGTSLVMILAVSARDHHGPCADHPCGRHRACRPAARRRRDRRAIWRDPDDPDQARFAAPGAGGHHPHRRSAHVARPRLASRRDLLDRGVCEAAPRPDPAARAGAADDRRGQASAGARRFRPPGPDSLQLHRRPAAVVRRDRLSRRPSARPAGRHRRRPAWSGRADPGARKAEDRGHLDERGFRTASARRRPSMPSPRRVRSPAGR